ncbi:hypothetical protein [Mycolicibacterium sp. A43C]
MAGKSMGFARTTVRGLGPWLISYRSFPAGVAAALARAALRR